MPKIFKNRCYNGGNKHKFEGRYSEEKRDAGNVEGKFTTAALKEFFKLQIYKGDV